MSKNIWSLRGLVYENLLTLCSLNLYKHVMKRFIWFWLVVFWVNLGKVKVYLVPAHGQEDSSREWAAEVSWVSRSESLRTTKQNNLRVHLLSWELVLMGCTVLISDTVDWSSPSGSYTPGPRPLRTLPHSPVLVPLSGPPLSTMKPLWSSARSHNAGLSAATVRRATPPLTPRRGNDRETRGSNKCPFVIGSLGNYEGSINLFLSLKLCRQ